MINVTESPIVIAMFIFSMIKCAFYRMNPRGYAITWNYKIQTGITCK